MGTNDCLLNGQEHGYGKIHQKSISTETFQFFVVAIIPQPDLDKIPQDEDNGKCRKSKKPVGSEPKAPHHFDKGKPRQQGKSDVEVSHPLFPKPDDEIPLSNGPICLFIRKLIDQDHVEDRKPHGDGKQQDQWGEEPREEKKAGRDGQPSITEANKNFPQTMVGPSNRLV